jgi:TolA-binding protein
MKPKNLSLLLLPLLLTSCFKTRSELAREKEAQEVKANLQQSVLASTQGVDKLQAEIGRLQGRIEELEHQRKKEMGGLQSGKESQEKTLLDLRKKVEELSSTQQTLFEEIKSLKTEQIQILKSLTEKSVSRPQATPRSAPPKAASFDAALKHFQEKNFKDAAAGFKAVLDSRPTGKRLLEANYYLGESLYRLKNYDDAIVAFAVVHEKSSKSTLGRKSTLRIAESFRALGKNSDAKAFAQLLIDGSPQSEEAKRAQRILK